MSAWVMSGGCDRESAPAPASKPAALPVPIEVTVEQRSTTPVPGSEDRLHLTTQDITWNQVITSLSGSSGDDTIRAPVSLSAGSSVSFVFEEVEYELRLKGLNNVLLGQDTATFIISKRSHEGLTETEKIERLIDSVALLKDAVFIRNGREHSGQAAADHLRRKWRRQADEIESARQFIDLLASRSSTTGEPYQIRLPDGRLVPAGAALHERLREIESGAE